MKYFCFILRGYAATKIQLPYYDIQFGELLLLLGHSGQPLIFSIALLMHSFYQVNAALIWLP